MSRWGQFYSQSAILRKRVKIMISPHGLEFYLIFGVDWFDLFRVTNVCRDCVYTS